ncbi:hypothetical protein MTR67_047640 [Solanum verrucosum]|uniref:Reverse transcriptase n=1 Tax=Solanum verrucosum TaxID=315347 RepID=A0AAF0UY64_SOLVR|nr:hypothetical protein MTR67_047640 [Solanum verrucosum]
MDFVVGLPRTSRGVESIWVIMDQLTMSAHFLLVHTSFSAERRQPFRFVVGDRVFLRVSPMKGVMRFGRRDESHVLQYDVVELDDHLQYDVVELDDHLTYIEDLVVILARDVRQLRSRAIPVVKVHPLEESSSREGYLGDRLRDAGVVPQLI